MIPHFLVCGLPGSGNHYLQRILRKAGATAIVDHGHDWTTFLCSAGDNPVALWYPFRRERERRLSAQRQNCDWGVERIAECAKNTARMAAMRAIPIELVEYECLRFEVYRNGIGYKLRSRYGLDINDDEIPTWVPPASGAE